jgi:hypothetical protein
MKKIFILCMLFSITITAYTQQQEIEEGMKRGKNGEGCYTAYLNQGELTVKKCNKWFSENPQFMLIALDEIRVKKFGYMKFFVTKIDFIPKSEEAEYRQIQEQLAAERSRKMNTSYVSGEKIAVVTAAVGGVGIMIDGLAKFVKPFTSGGSSGNFSTSSSNTSSTTSSPNTSSTSSYKDPIDLYILSIGTDEKCYADNDANAIVNRLKRGEGDKDLYSKVYTRTLTTSNATKANIQEALNWVRQNANENDIFLLFFSGHGGRDSTNKNKFHFASYDDNKISVDDIIQGIGCTECQTIIWFDACRAGQVSQDFANNIDDYIRQHKKPNVNIMMSSRDYEFSYPDLLNHLGYFTKAIIDGLNGAADQSPFNHFISLRELCEYVARVVPQRVSEQIPQRKTDQTPQHWIHGKFSNTRLSRY